MALVEEDDEQRILPLQQSSQDPHPDKHRLWTLAAIGAVCIALCIALLVVLARRAPLRTAVPECASLASDVVNQTVGLFPANRQRLLARFNGSGLIYMSGAVERQRNADTNYQFRQNSNFLWLTGVELVNVSVIIDIEQRNCTLFINPPDFYAIVFDGLLWSLPDLMRQYQVESVMYWSNMTQYLEEKYAAGITTVYTFPDDQLPFVDHYNWTIDTKELEPAMIEERYVKSAQELALMQLVADISSDGHEEAMRRAKGGMYEFQVQSIFEAQLTYCGVNRLAYPTILGGGPNGAFLHYELNTRKIEKGEIVLVDAGGEYMGYGIDITRTWPVSGKFSAEQLEIYNMVLDTQLKTIEFVKAGVSWIDVSKFAAATLCDNLIKNNFVLVDQTACLDNRLNYLFMPHGLGHTVGLDVHDVTIYDVKVNSVWTVEPGVYFNPFVFESAYANATLGAMLNKSKIESYANFGGVRIEDTIVVLEQGTRVMSSAPKMPHDIEVLMGHA